MTPNSVRLLLLSDIGDRYDPVAGKGRLGKNLTHRVPLMAGPSHGPATLLRYNHLR